MGETDLKIEKKAILVVEDTLSQYLLLVALLRKKDFIILHAENGMEAVSMVKGHRVNLVIMDIVMPGMDGLTATKEIRKFNSDIPIIAVTASMFSTYEGDAISCGCNAFLSKPFDLKYLIYTIDKWI